MSNTKVLITGATGLLGKSLVETRPDEIDLHLMRYMNSSAPMSFFETWYTVDVRYKVDVLDVFQRVGPDIVIHCAAIGSVDYAELHFGEVSAVNLRGTENIVDVANEYKARVVHISTNAVFAGENPPYSETSTLAPINAYGIIKNRAEQYVRDMADRWMIFRPFLLYGWPYPGGRSNWAVTIIDKLRGETPLHLVNDYLWMPTYAPDCAEAIWRLVFEFDDNEIFNIAAPDKVSLYRFGLEVCKVF